MPAPYHRRPSYGTKPNLFIVGAPKAGTTSLYHYLKDHPLTSASVPKETYYFSEHISSAFPDFTKERFLSLWEEDNKPIRFEATPLYFHSKEASNKINAFNPQAKIIIMLREPTQLLHRLHNQYRLGVIEPIETFEEAIKAETQRRKRQGPNNTDKTLFYSTYVKFSKHIQRYREQFGHENVHVLLLKDLANKPEKTYQQVLKFLNLPPHHPSYEQYNQSKKLQNPKLHSLLFHPNNRFKDLAKAILPDNIYIPLSRAIYDLTTSNPLPSMSERTRKALKKQLKREVERTTNIIQRDLVSIWGYENVISSGSGPLHIS